MASASEWDAFTLCSGKEKLEIRPANDKGQPLATLGLLSDARNVDGAFKQGLMLIDSDNKSDMNFLDSPTGNIVITGW